MCVHPTSAVPLQRALGPQFTHLDCHWMLILIPSSSAALGSLVCPRACGTPMVPHAILLHCSDRAKVVWQRISTDHTAVRSTTYHLKPFLSGWNVLVAHEVETGAPYHCLSHSDKCFAVHIKRTRLHLTLLESLFATISSRWSFILTPKQICVKVEKDAPDYLCFNLERVTHANVSVSSDKGPSMWNDTG